MAKSGFHAWTYTVALLILVVFSYGILAFQLGFYWDDWPAIWFLHVLGPGGFPDVFSIDRPLLGRLFMLTTSLLGESILAWQFFGIVTRWVSSLALWWTLKSLWPAREQETAWIAILFALYPGFMQQFISVTYSHVFLILTAFLLSLGAMVWALRKPTWFWPLTMISLGASSFSMFSIEYFFGLELLRPLLIWILLSQRVKEKRKKWTRTILHWLPYLAIIIIFMTWRIFLQSTPRGEVKIIDRLQESPGIALLSLINTILQDVLESGLIAWLQTLDVRRFIDFGLLPTLFSLGMVLVVGIIAILYLVNFRPAGQSGWENQSQPGRGWALTTTFTGLYALMVGGWPFWVTELPVKLRFPWDRFNLAMMLGSSLLLVGLISLIGRSRLQRIILIGTLVGLAAGFHFYKGEQYRREWDLQKTLFWQLIWRAPRIEPGTALITSKMPFVYYSDNSLTGPLNWIYAPDTNIKQMDYLLVDIEIRLGNELPGFEPGLPVVQPYRATSFQGSTSQALVFFYSPPRCLKIMDNETDDLLPKKPRFIPKALPLSRIELIEDRVSTQAELPAHIFGPEPEHNWCYYFEKADLARQKGDWQDIAILGDMLFSSDGTSIELSSNEIMDMMERYSQAGHWEKTAELTPFIHGYAHTGLWNKAQQLTLKAYKISPKLKNYLCSNWHTIQNATPSDQSQDETLNNVIQNLGCSFE